MAVRKLKNGESVEELDSPISLTVRTKCPEKYLLIDLETGQTYRGENAPNKYGQWKRVENDNEENNL